MIHVYQIPAKRSNGFCFNGPIPITFHNVDWMDTPLELEPAEVIKFLRQKQWYTTAAVGTEFLVLCKERGDLTFTLERM